MRTRTYTDLDLDFYAHPNSQDVPKLKNASSVIRAFRNLVYTRYYDCPFQPAKGNFVAGALFENDDAFTVEVIRTEILQMADLWEERISDLTVEVTFQEGNSYRVDMTFRVIGLLEPVSFSIILERAR